MLDLTFRRATAIDVPLLARLNQQLQIDEAHRLRMQLPELVSRMTNWIDSGGYEAVLFTCVDSTVGYTLYRREADHVYLKQFFVNAEYRRQSVGRQAFEWLSSQMWKEVPAVFLDVLVHNERGIAFWRSVGFGDYCITMEKNLVSR